MRFSNRKWGWYLTLLDFGRFKVKILKFRKGRACSKQYHNLRNELWLFLKGDGYFNGRYINAGKWRAVHRKRKHQYVAIKSTWVLEIQYGDNCIENDIVRL